VPSQSLSLPSQTSGWPGNTSGSSSSQSSPPQTIGTCPSPSLSSASYVQIAITGSQARLLLHGSPPSIASHCAVVAHAAAGTQPAWTSQNDPAGHAVAPLL